ncbi:ubiquitin-like-conjugating enzyme ATG10 [Anthonomus grandis grandis]|uniref:ubiquitin-like-conjugating enzyme ATG10 n=1 Tax=Anthonomus grandis grandis TaxID=2921223 RepID=UPI002165A604|nr:ubiquitin-like-conjugating enzyme ATG10 [Anthonomus grandis grandis]
MEQTAISYDKFHKCISEIVKISDKILDGWHLHVKDDLSYLAKKSTTLLGDTVVTFEYHIAFNLSYGVPVLCFNVWRQDGSMLSMEEYWSTNKYLKESNMFDTLTQMDHPVLCRPFLTLHPCKTEEIMQPVLAISKNPVVSWLSVVSPFVHLELLDDYVKCC